MISDPFLKWAVTIAFVITTVFWAARSSGRSVAIAGRVTGILHVVMSLAMIAMVWPHLPHVPTAAGIIVFAAAATVFLILLAVRGEHRVENGYHALMMATMMWMYVVMDSSILGGTRTSSGGGTMDMGGGSTMSMPMMMTMHLPSWAGSLNLVLGLAYVLTAGAWVAFAYRRAPGDTRAGEPDRTGVMQAVMAGATAAMFLSYTG